MPDEKVAITLRLPADLKRHLEWCAAAESRTLNGELVYLLARATKFGLWAPTARVPASGETRVVEAPKAGRNAPCPCGSGKKYKHCHGRSSS